MMLSREGFRRAYGAPALLGMVHLSPLPGAPGWGGSLEAVIDRALRDAEALESAGFTGVVVENFGDRPFPKVAAPVTIASMAVVAAAIRRASSLPLGINILRNDIQGALAVAAATGASFVRVNVHAGVMVTDQGLIEGDAAGTLRLRRELGLEGVALFADLLVKHARPLVEVALAESALELRERALADVVLLTGVATGAPVDAQQLRELREVLPDAPLVVASGVDESNVSDLATIADGFIVGTAVKEGGVSDAPVDRDRARRLAERVK